MDDGKALAAEAASGTMERGGTAAASGRARWRFNVSAYLVALLLVALLPTFVFSAIVLVRSSNAQNEVFQDLFIATTRSVSQVVDRDVANMITTLRVLATGDPIGPGAYPNVQERATRALAGTRSYLIAVDGEMNQLFNTRIPFGEALPKVSDPATVKKAIESGWPEISDLFYGRTARTWVVNVVLPVKDPASTAKALILTQNAESFRDAVSTERLPEGWNAALVDRRRMVIASSLGEDEIGKPFFIPYADDLTSGFAQVDFGGASYKVTVQPSDLTGWSIVSWAPTALVESTINRWLLWLVGGGLVIALMVAAAAFLIARSVSRAVRMLALDARRLGRGDMVNARKSPIAEIETVSEALAEAASSRKAAEGEIRFLMREIAHRSKNQLTVIQAMLNQTIRMTESKEDFAEAFRKRIAGLARSTDLMISNASDGVELRALVIDQIETFRPRDPARVRLEGPYFRLDAQSAQIIGMALHELSTNAAKYGAFSGPEGRLDVVWGVNAEHLDFTWRESAVALVERPERKGFGSIVLERILGMSLSAELDRAMHADGIEWRFRIPLEKLRSARGGTGPMPEGLSDGEA